MDSVRTCTACRHKDDRAKLLRFVRAVDGEIRFDEKAVLPARGAWLCPKRACLVKAFDKRMLFRTEKTLPTNSQVMLSVVIERVKLSILSRLGLLRRMGQCELGRDAVKTWLKTGQAELVLLAGDLAERSIREMNQAAELSGAKAVLRQSSFSMLELGQSLGREKTGVVALSKGRISDEILLQLGLLSDLGSVKPQLLSDLSAIKPKTLSGLDKTKANLASSHESFVEIKPKGQENLGF